MEGLWQNPELVRHVRTELRPKRMIMAAAVSTFVCLLILVTVYNMGESYDKTNAAVFYSIVVSLQSGLLCLWCLHSSSQGIASERALKTYDFLRTTRLTSGELLLGMLFGLPLMAYFIVGCTLPFSLWAGLAAGYSLGALVATYGMLLLVSTVISLAGLTVSMLAEKPRAGALILLLLFFGWPLIGLAISSGSNSSFPGLIAIAVVPGLLPLYEKASLFAYTPAPWGTTASFLGSQTPLLMISVILYATAGAWLAVALVRNLKKDLEDIRLLSRWQVIGFAAYVNVLLFALLDLRTAVARAGGNAQSVADGVTSGYLALNYLILCAVGLAMLARPEHLKTWWRQSGSLLERYWSENGPPWPWMTAAAAAAIALFGLEAFFSSRLIPLGDWPVPAARLLILLSYAVRDVLFLQWCLLTRMKAPVIKGILFLSLYYGTVAILVTVLFDNQVVRKNIALLLTPLGGVILEEKLPVSLAGALVNVAIVVFLSYAIQHRISRPAAARATAGS